MAVIVSSGVTSTGLTLAYSEMIIYKGGLADQTILSSCGLLTVSNGGVATNTVAKNTGTLYISRGGVANQTTLNNGGSMLISSAGTVNNTTINSGGMLVISGGGVANNNTVTPCGSLHVSSGGTANSTTLEGSSFDYYKDYQRKFLYFLACIYVSNGGVAINTTLNKCSELHVLNGGKASNTTVHGNMYVYAGGVADQITIYDDNRLLVYSGGVANKTTITQDSLLFVSSYATFNDTTIDWGGSLYVESNGLVQKTIVNGNLGIREGGIAKQTIVNNGGHIFVSSGGTALAIQENGGYVEFDSGTEVTFLANSFKKLDLTWYNSATIHSGTTANDTTVGYHCHEIVFDGGTVNNTSVYASGLVIVSSGGVANNTTLSGDSSFIYALNYTLGRLNVSQGGVANNTVIGFGGYMYVEGTANSATVTSGGAMAVSGTANHVTLNGGNLYLYGMGSNTTVNYGGCMRICSGAAHETTVNSDGALHIQATHSGRLQIADGAFVSAYQGAIIDFTVAEQKVPSQAFIKDWSRIIDGFNAKYTITVNANQANGNYILAGGTSDFDEEITVKTVDGSTLGVLAPGDTKNFGGVDYTLSQSNDRLSLTIGGAVVEPAVSDYNGSGKSDMIQFVNGLVYVTYDTASGYVQTPAINDITGWNVTEIRRDLTGDGYADIQITSYDGASQTWVATLHNDYVQTGSITLNYQFIGAYQTELWSYLGSADFNGDGKSEILMIQTNAGKDQYGHRNVAGWITDSETCEWVDNIWLGALDDNWDVAGTADVTGDGADNVLLRRSDGMIGYWDKAGTNNIVELKNAGNRVLLTTGDFDGDGAADFLWKSLDGDAFSVWNDLSGAFTDASLGKVSELGGSWIFAGVGDYNGDGKDEILWCDTTTYQTAYSEGNKTNFGRLSILGSAQFIQKTSQKSGGALENCSCLVLPDDTLFIENCSAQNGGAVSNQGQLVLSDTTFYANNAAQNGGALWNENVIDVTGNVSFSTNSATLGGAIFNENLIHLTGVVTLVTNADTWVNQGSGTAIATTNWDLRNAADGYSVRINNFEYFSNVGTQTRQTITVNTNQKTGDYIIATGADLSNLTGKNSFLITVDNKTYSSALTVGGAAVSWEGRSYQLCVIRTELILTVSELPAMMAMSAPCGDVWALDCESCISDLTETSFANDVISIDVGALTGSWTLLCCAEGAITDLADAESVCFGSSAAEWTGASWSDGIYTLATDEKQSQLIVSKIA